VRAKALAPLFEELGEKSAREIARILTTGTSPRYGKP